MAMVPHSLARTLRAATRPPAVGAILQCRSRLLVGAASALSLLGAPSLAQPLSEAPKLEADESGDRLPALSLGTLAADPMITGATPASPRIELLGSLEFKTERTPYQAAWSILLSRMTKETPLYAACRKGSASCSPALERWQRLIESVMPALQQLNRLNPTINGMAVYADDPVVYGVSDYWASPGEFLKGRADCEDYAIVKYFSLLQLGFAPPTAQDRYRQGSEPGRAARRSYRRAGQQGLCICIGQLARPADRAAVRVEIRTDLFG